MLFRPLITLDTYFCSCGSIATHFPIDKLTDLKAIELIEASRQSHETYLKKKYCI